MLAHIDGDVCELHVSDSGSGIPPEDRERIFEPLRAARSAREAGGSGLGLAIARWIAEVHGGTLRVAESGPQGTTFTARLLHGEIPWRRHADTGALETPAAAKP